MVAGFTFYDYVDENGVNVIHEWLHGDGKDGRARFNQWIAHLAATPQSTWRRPQWDKMDESRGKKKTAKDWADLYEIRRTGSVQLRLIVCFGPGNNSVTILAGCAHKDKQWIPSNIASLAQRRRESVFANPDDRRMEHDDN